MILVLALLQIAYPLYFLELIQNSLLIKLDESHKAILILQGQVSHIQDENNYQYCQYHNLGCWVRAINATILFFDFYLIKIKSSMLLLNDYTSNRFEYFQLKLGEFQIYDQEKHSFNTEIISFLHTFMEYQANEINNNFISLSPFATILNSFVYFGYTLCISEEDGYLKTNQNNAILKNQLNITGIKSKVQKKQKETRFSIRIQFLEYNQQVFDISNYSIILDNEIENCIIPIELMMSIHNLALSQDFFENAFDHEFSFFYRETIQYRIESLGSIKFYNYVNQPLLMMPENYIEYNYNNLGVDILRLAGTKVNTQLVLGRSFLKNKIIHFSSQTQEIFIEQLQGESCNLQQLQRDSLFDLLLFKIIFIIIMSIFVYGIFRKIRAQYLLKGNQKIEQQHLILNNEVEVLK